MGYGGTTKAAAAPNRLEAEASTVGRRRIRTTNLLLFLLVALGGVWLLRVAQAVFIPLALGLSFTMLVYPIRRRVARASAGWVAATAAATAFLAAAAGLAAALYGLLRFSSGQFAEVYPRLIESLRSLMAWGESRGLPIESLMPAAVRDSPPGTTPPLAELLSGPRLASAAAFFSSGLNSAIEVVVVLGLAMGVMLLLLVEAPRWDERLCRVWGDRGYHETRDVVRANAVQLRRYLWAKTISGLVAGGLTAGLAWVTGVPLALVWGALSFLFNYIPNVGVFISGVPPAVLAIALLGPGQAMLFVGGLVVIELVTGNLLDPLITGKATILSPLEVLVGLMFWGWMWGVAGALLSVPLTAAVVIAMRHLGPTRRLGKFVTDS